MKQSDETRAKNDAVLGDYRRHMLAAGRGPATIRQYIFHLNSLTALSRDLLAATEAELERYLASKRRTHAAESRKAMRTAFRSFYGWTYKSGRSVTNPAEDLLPIYIPRAVARRAPDGDVVHALELASLPEKAAILLARLACLRLNELTTLHTEQREGSVLRIMGKGERPRIVPINAELAEVLDRLEKLQGVGYYFPGRWGGHMHKDAMSKMISRRLGWNPHSLRHAGATAAFRGTGDLRAVQELLGHASVATTQRYVHVEEEQIRRAAEATSLGGGYRSAGPLERTAFDSRTVIRGGRE